MTSNNTEKMDAALLDLELRSDNEILQALVDSQQRAVTAAAGAINEIGIAALSAANRLSNGDGRLVMVGAGASGRLAVQDGAELWPTYGWPHERSLLSIAGGNGALLQSVEGVEDDAQNAINEVLDNHIGSDDVVIAVAASGQSPWTCAWMHEAHAAGALTIGIANNADTQLLENAEYPILLDSGAEVLAGSTRMSAGTAQKVMLNMFTTLLMIRLNRTYGNLMVDMAAVNNKLNDRRQRMLLQIHPQLSKADADNALTTANGWIKLAAVIATGCSVDKARALLEQHNGNLRLTLKSL